MPSTAEFTTYNAETVVKLGNASLFRPIPVSMAGWTKLRMAIRWKIHTTQQLVATDNVKLWGPPWLFFGISHGTLGWNDYDASNHCLGVAQSLTANWTLNLGAPAYNYCNPYIVKLVGTTITNGTSYVGANNIMSSEASVCMGTNLLEIRKGNPNFVCTFLGRAQGSANRGISSPWVEGLEALFTKQDATQLLYDSGAWDVTVADTTIAVDEVTNGAFDHVCLSWDHEYTPIYISDFAIAKYA